ncbi:hypothetical protein [Evansella cellulosilytica]|uniref:hypothetical protein n=1 Tax=Evansella cellulosilytica TaxID=1413 RepID=UPI0012F69544|nr:hypothetical protein [Evansella cellulosilytica]
MSLNGKGLYKYDITTEEHELLLSASNEEDRFYATLSQNPHYVYIQEGGNSIIYDLTERKDYPVEFVVLGILENGKAWYRDNDDYKVYVVDFKSGDKEVLLDHSDEEGGRDYRLETIDVSYDGSTLYYTREKDDDIVLMKKDISNLTK